MMLKSNYSLRNTLGAVKTMASCSCSAQNFDNGMIIDIAFAVSFLFCIISCAVIISGIIPVISAIIIITYIINIIINKNLINAE